LQVGPQSAGSDPGPACYGQGGTAPTTTDANLVLGYLNSDGLVGGRLPLDLKKAETAIRTQIAEPLGISLEKAAYGMFTIVNANMVNGIRRVSVERGYDPRDFVLVCAGGATGAHITALASSMGIKTIIVPKLASGLCAFGQIISDVKYNYMATCPVRLDNDEALDRINKLFNELEAQGIQHLKTDGFSKDRIKIRRSLEMRYVGQVHECTVEIDNFAIGPKTVGRLKQAFNARHEELYTYSEPNSVIEVVNLESTLYGLIDKPESGGLPKGKGADTALRGTRKAIFTPDGRRQRVPVYDGAKLGAGDNISGPAIIEEVTTTIVIEPRWTARLDGSGSYLISRE
jgi:N-methylhydantoinase A